MRLAGAGAADQQQVLPFADIFAPQEFPHQRFVDRYLGGEVERLDGFQYGEGGFLDPPFGGAAFAVNQLSFGQPQQIRWIIRLCYYLHLMPMFEENKKKFESKKNVETLIKGLAFGLSG
jgi:hypothetical protein